MEENHQSKKGERQKEKNEAALISHGGSGVNRTTMKNTVSTVRASKTRSTMIVPIAEDMLMPVFVLMR